MSTPVSSSRSATAAATYEQSTLIVQAQVVSTDHEIIRHIGVDSAVTVAEFHTIVGTCFNLYDHETNRYHCNFGGITLDPESLLREHLRADGDEFYCVVGPWHIRIQLIETITRDNGTPTALCVGGFGSIAELDDDHLSRSGDDFDLTEINAQLTGEDTIEAVLSHTREEPANLIRRSGILDFVPLLQAIDFSRTSDLDPEVVMICAVLPVEETPIQQDAFWSIVLGLSCMSDEELTDAIIESIVQALGWNKTADEVRSLCPYSLKHLKNIGGLASPVERIEIYRELLRL
ncbi:MAG: hypothetical protein Q4A82_01625 [Corynebacterium sp.]|nr:hypothetical protein [Corynebacterium sp.]